MIFTSLTFFFFFSLFFLLFWVVKKRYHLQNILVVLASYVFYGWWDFRFLLLIIFSSCLDYWIGRELGKEEDITKRKFLLFCSIGVNLSILGFFKYFNFFVSSFTELIMFFGGNIHYSTLDIILPIGISFYTFQTLSYTIDVYRRKIEPTRDVVAFLAFVSFFPQLLAGPIERAKDLLPQFLREKSFSYELAVSGCRLILWGVFKKIVIADPSGNVVNAIFENPTEHTASTLLVGAILFGFQIYADFSGYSDMAIGMARLLGIQLKRNFNFPYFSRDIGEFWRRWHISLSAWFKDYVYIPLGGNRSGKFKTIRNIIIVFVVSGLWHGANNTFVIWGVLHGVLFIPAIVRGRHRSFVGTTVAETRFYPNMLECFQMLRTYTLVTIGWIFFRSETVADAYTYMCSLIDISMLQPPMVIDIDLLAAILLLITTEWVYRKNEYVLEFSNTSRRSLRWGIYILLIVLIITRIGEPQEFIYFQF